MNEKPIIFSGSMVQAILDGRKTQTRRVIRGLGNRPHYDRLLGEWTLSEPPCRYTGTELWQMRGASPSVGDWIWILQTAADDFATYPLKCPYGKPGDRLWVRETWNRDERNEDCLFYAADYAIVPHPKAHTVKPATYPGCKPSIHMPRWASRINLTVLDVGVERVQDISEEDAIAEGVGHGFQMNAGWPDYQHIDKHGVCSLTQDTARMSFASLWDSINAKRGFGWDVNPWVWVVTFRIASEISQTPRKQAR